MKHNQSNSMRRGKKFSRFTDWILAAYFSSLLLAPCWGQLPPVRPPLPRIDKRHAAAQDKASEAQKSAAVAVLRHSVPSLKVEFEPVTGSAKRVSSTEGFLTGPEGKGATISAASLAGVAANDPHRVTKAFILEHQNLFGHGPEALASARIKREYVTPHNGLKTVVWEQQLDGIAVFESALISHTTRNGELVSVNSSFLPNLPAAADAGTPGRAALQAAPGIPARRAVALAAASLAESVKEDDVVQRASATGVELRQQLQSPGLKGNVDAWLTWFPMNAKTMRLCWDIILTSSTRGEMFRILVDVQTGEVLLRRCLTAYLSDASYRVFTSDSPSPLSPGYATPVTNQPPLVARTLVTLSALDTNASPAGWINDGGNETWGNNVDAHTDRNADNSPDLPRPQGSPFRVFDFPMSLTTQDPTNYSSAAVVQLFYLCNWYHDKMYQLGFTEAAGNFQSNNFARGGLGNDAVQADAQDGGGTDNANFSTPPDGSPGRMQMYIFTSMSPRRDGDLDAEIVLHEYTHGLSWRLVGGGQGLGTTQSDGMGEGWSDFYGLSLLSEAGDDVNGNYAAGAYASYKIGGASDLQNYYFGIRRYPYSTDMTKNPLTFKDIDPAQADYCASGVPYHTAMFGSCSGGDASEVHNEGEVWCVTLWEARANLINRYGWATGNQLILQLVTDGMKLTPPSPNFLQARDAIIQADLVNTGGANKNELWAAFAKRGMGFSATSPSSSTTTGVHESFDLPDDLLITPTIGFTSRGPVGGPFDITSQTLTLTNVGTNAFTWTLVNTSSWLNVSPTSGTLTPGGATASVTASLNGTASSLPMGIYAANVLFSNQVSGAGQSRTYTLRVGQPDYFTELFTGDNDLDYQSFTFTPDGSSSLYASCREVATNFPTDPAGGTTVTLSDDSYTQVTLTGTNSVAIYNRRTNVFFIASNGYLTMNSGDSTYSESFVNHFNRPRVSACFDDLNPASGGTISWKQTTDRVAVTFNNVREYGSAQTVSFQIELFFDGRICVTYLNVGITDGLAGLSAGLGVPSGFEESNLSGYGSCTPPDDLAVTPGAGLNSQGSQGGPFTPSTTIYTLRNGGTNSLTWSVAATQPWITLSSAGGSLVAGATNDVTVSINAAANALPPGNYTDTLVFSNLTSGAVWWRAVSLSVVTPALSIADASVLEGNSGTTDVIFNVSLTPATLQTVTVAFATSNGTAQAGSDYMATNGILTFAPGETNGSVIVTILGDTNAEPNEAFFINLTNPTNALLARAQATGTILSDDVGPFFDDFEPGIDLAQWSAFGGSVGSTVLATNYGGYVSSPNSLWFGAATNRFAASRSLNTLQGGVLDFWLRIASGSSSTWETADLPGEGIVLEYSINAGSSWTEISRYTNSSYTAWTHVTVDIPVAAQTANTQFRWRQLSNSGTGFDHWALDDVGVTVGPRPPVIATQPANQTVLLGGSATFNVVASGSAPLSYQWRLGAAASSPQLITDLESFPSGTANGTVLFRDPRLSGSTSGFLDATPNLASVTDIFPGGHPGAKVLNVTWSFAAGTTNPWLRLTTYNPANLPNPTVDFNQKVQFDIYTDRPIKVGLGLRETSTTAPIGGDGGTAGTIEFIGVPSEIGSTPNPSRTVPAGSWTTLLFDIPLEAITAFTGNGILESSTGKGVLEHLAIVPADGAGTYNVYLDNFTVVSTTASAVDIPGATNATLTLVNVQTNDAGFYSVLVTNDYGSALSSDALLTVEIPQPPSVPFGPIPTNYATAISVHTPLSWNSGVFNQIGIVDLGHPVLVPYTANNISTEDRSVAVVMNSSVSVSSLGIMVQIGTPTVLEVTIRQVSGTTRGAVLATASTSVSPGALAFVDVPIAFSFNAGERYDIAFNVTGGWGNPSSHYLAFYDFDNLTLNPALGYDVDAFKVLDGASGGGYGNSVMPHLRAGGNTGVGQTAFVVFFGTNSTSTPQIATNLTQTTCNPGTLAFDTTYYWQVVASNVVGSVTGAVWQFTTTLDEVYFASATSSVSENGGSALITIVRENPACGPLSVGYFTTNGTATAGADYTAVSGTLTFAAGVMSTNFPVPILDDSLGEGNETVLLQLSQITPNVFLGSNAVLTIVDNDGPPEFQIGGLFTSNSQVVDHDTLTSDDRGGIAVSTSQAFVTGDSATARFNAADLTGGTSLGIIRDSLCTDLRTETVYLLGNGSTPLTSSGGTVTTLIELNGATGQSTGVVIPLSQSFAMPSSGNGIFSGYGRVVVHNSARVYDIFLPSGMVTDRGTMMRPNWMFSESWSVWGVAEYFGGDLYLTYARNTYPVTTIERARVTDGVTDVVGTFSNLSDMASFTVSPSRNRWYFHYEGSGQFGGTSETLGYADAQFIFISTNSPVVIVQPASLTVRPGTNVTFCVSAVGAQTYHWRKDGTNLVNGGRIAGATNACLTISSVVEADSGQYSVALTNAYGFAISSNGTLLVSALDHFAWDNIPSPQLVGTPFAATITAQDEFGSVVSNFTGRVEISGWSGSSELRQLVTFDDLSGGGSVPVGYGGLTWNNFYYAIGTNSPNSGYPPGTISQPNVAFNSFGTPASIVSTGQFNFVSAYLTAAWNDNLQVHVAGYAGATLVYSNSYALSATAPTLINFNYLGVTQIDFISSGGTPHPGYSGSGTHFAMDNVVIGGSAASPVSITPTNSGNFVNGAWTGDITVLQPATNLILVATDSAGHRGTSTNFDVLLANDLSVAIVDQSDPLAVGGYLTNTITVANSGPTAATGVMATNFLPAFVAFVSATASQGSCVLVGSQVECALGTLAGGAAATVTVATKPGVAGQITNLVAVGRAEADAYVGNNSAASVTTMLMPALSVADASVVEGNAGTTDTVFAIQLVPASPLPVTVAFATSDGTAQAGSDYIATNGLLTFTAGQTNAMVMVAVLGDTNAEPNETFFVNLTAPTNALLARTQAVGTILGDDLPPFFDDFEPGIDLAQWSAFGGSVGSTVLATNYGGYVSSPNSLWFGAATNRYAASRSLNTTVGGVADFWLRIANGSSSTWETADLPGEGIVLEYSVNSGGTWVEFGRYDTSTYTAWTHVTVDIPVAAQTANTQFRWRQLSNSGTGFDHWALDDVGVTVGPRPPVIATQPANQTMVVGDSAMFSVTASGSTPLSYFWRRNGTPIAGATGSSYITNNVQLADSGSQFSCLVSNAYGTALSSNAVLTVVTGLVSVAVFDHPSYVDTGGGISAESDNVQASLTNLGYPVVTFTNIISGIAGRSVVLIPELENGDLAAALTAPERTALQNFVQGGGTLVIHGSHTTTRTASLINSLLVTSVAEVTETDGTVYNRTEQATGTSFAGNPATVAAMNGSTYLTTASLPAGVLSIYTNNTRTLVAVLPSGMGRVVFLGWDWYDAAPIGTQNGGWLQVLSSAVTFGGVATNQPPIMTWHYNTTSGTLELAWSGTGFRLQAQTNSVGVGMTTNWFNFPGGTNSPVTITLDPANPSVFFRLVWP